MVALCHAEEVGCCIVHVSEDESLEASAACRLPVIATFHISRSALLSSFKDEGTNFSSSFALFLNTIVNVGLCLIEYERFDGAVFRANFQALFSVMREVVLQPLEDSQFTLR